MCHAAARVAGGEVEAVAEVLAGLARATDAGAHALAPIWFTLLDEAYLNRRAARRSVRRRRVGSRRRRAGGAAALRRRAASARGRARPRHRRRTGRGRGALPRSRSVARRRRRSFELRPRRASPACGATRAEPPGRATSSTRRGCSTSCGRSARRRQAALTLTLGLPPLVACCARPRRRSRACVEPAWSGKADAAGSPAASARTGVRYRVFSSCAMRLLAWSRFCLRAATQAGARCRFLASRAAFLAALLRTCEACPSIFFFARP